MKRKPRQLTEAQQHQADELRAKYRTLKAAGLHASAKQVRRRLVALLGNFEDERLPT